MTEAQYFEQFAGYEEDEPNRAPRDFKQGEIITLRWGLWDTGISESLIGGMMMSDLLWRPTDPHPFQRVASGEHGDRLLAALEGEFGYFPLRLNVTHLDRLRALTGADPVQAYKLLVLIDAIKDSGEIEVNYE